MEEVFILRFICRQIKYFIIIMDLFQASRKHEGQQTSYTKQKQESFIDKQLYWNERNNEQNSIFISPVFIDRQNLQQVSQDNFQQEKYHQFIGALFTNDFSGKIYKGSGVLISPNLVLTSASNVFRGFMEMKDVYFYPGLNGTMDVRSRYRGVDFRYPRQFTQPFSPSKHDFCLIKLEKRVPTFDQKSQLRLGVNFKDLQACLSIYGYPESESYSYDGDGNLIEGYQRGQEKKKITKVNDTQIFYQIDAADGQAGCPVITGGNKDIVVGIHKGGVIQCRQLKMAVKLTLEIILMLEIWRQELGGDEFKVFDVESGQQIKTSSYLFKNALKLFVMTNNELAFNNFSPINDKLSNKNQYHQQKLQGLYQKIAILEDKLNQQNQIKKNLEAKFQSQMIKLQLLSISSSQSFKKQLDNLISLGQKHQEQVLKLQQKLMEYEYWIVEADRLHYNLLQAIANSPFKHKFAQFRQVAEEINSTLEKEMGSWQVQQKGQNLGGSFIESGIAIQNKTFNALRLQKRLSLQSKLQMFEEIIEDLLQPFENK